MLLQLCLRQQPQIAGPFLELVQSLSALHLLPQRALATDAPGDSAGNSGSSSSGQEGLQQGVCSVVCVTEMLEAQTGADGSRIDTLWCIRCLQAQT